jgi:hypothetical protein
MISKEVEKEIVFKSSVLAWIRNWTRIRIEQKCWIRIRIKSIRIHNPGKSLFLRMNADIYFLLYLHLSHFQSVVAVLTSHYIVF